MIGFMFACIAGIAIQDDSLQAKSDASNLWTRKTTGEHVVSIELVSRKYVAEGKPELWLVGVAHIADASFYNDVSELLDEMDIVLYESVRPTGSRAPSGITDQEKVDSTRLSMEFVADVAQQIAEQNREIPTQLPELFIEVQLKDARLASFVEDASVDAWGRPYSLQINNEENSISFWSFGSDGVAGGEGSASDLIVTRVIVFNDEDEQTLEESSIQEGMADVLGLEFQLDALSYENPNWFCSDLTIGEVEQKLEERGGNPDILKSITGEAFTAKIASGMMKLIPMLDMLTGGGVQETARLLLIEILTMPDTDTLLEGIEPELAEVIIVDRNTAVLKDIAATIEIVEEVSSIGILYGAGHMVDFERRLGTTFGYVPVEEKWFVAMSANPEESFLDAADMRRMQFMLRYQMHKANQE